MSATYPNHAAQATHATQPFERWVSAAAGLTGTIDAIASKSVAHRALICAAGATSPTELICNTSSQDIEATVQCLRSLGATLTKTATGYHIKPLSFTNSPTLAADKPSEPAQLMCNESGSTLRFMLPVVAALGQDALLHGKGRLAARPLSPLYEELQAAGVSLSAQGTLPLKVSGTLQRFDFTLAGNISSQYITGLLLAAPLTGHSLRVHVLHPVESASYINITCEVMRAFGVHVTQHEEPGATCYEVPAARYSSPGSFRVEGDWSNAAFWLCAAALQAARPNTTQNIYVHNLSPHSTQGDKAVLQQLQAFGAKPSFEQDCVRFEPAPLHAATIDVQDCPDLVPPLAVVAALAPGQSRIEGAARLRLKESDRIETVAAGLKALGAHIATGPDYLSFTGVPTLTPGTVDAANDHRIAMMGALASLGCTGPVHIQDAACVRKSYPGFYDDFSALGGHVTNEAPSV